MLHEPHSAEMGNPLLPLFEQIVCSVYENKLGIHDQAMTHYVAGLLCEFTHTDKLYPLRDATGQVIDELAQMVVAADPVHGTAASFDTERAVRKYIGDYALFVTGMYGESMDTLARIRARKAGAHSPTFDETVRAGKESYYIVSQFDLFEYQREAPLFARLSDAFERCLEGLRVVREELTRQRPGLLPRPAAS